jgi:hypothetical protein
MTGRLGEVKLGMPVSDVFSVLGKSEGVGKGLRGWTIESYSGGCLQIAHKRRVVGLIGVYFDPGSTAPPVLPGTAGCGMPFSGQTTTGQFRAYLEDNRIPCEPDTRLRDAVALRVGVGVIASFEDDRLRSLLTSV